MQMHRELEARDESLPDRIKNAPDDNGPVLKIVDGPAKAINAVKTKLYEAVAKPIRPAGLAWHYREDEREASQRRGRARSAVDQEGGTVILGSQSPSDRAGRHP